MTQEHTHGSRVHSQGAISDPSQCSPWRCHTPAGWVPWALHRCCPRRQWQDADRTRDQNSSSNRARPGRCHRHHHVWAASPWGKSAVVGAWRTLSGVSSNSFRGLRADCCGEARRKGRISGAAISVAPSMLFKAALKTPDMLALAQAVGAHDPSTC